MVLGNIFNNNPNQNLISQFADFKNLHNRTCVLISLYRRLYYVELDCY